LLSIASTPMLSPPLKTTSLTLASTAASPRFCPC
jgi:hypothetical protein